MTAKIFDKHDWKPMIFETAEEINEYIKSNHIKEKRITRINTIGISGNMEEGAYVRSMRTTLAGVGIPYNDIDNGVYAGIDSTLYTRLSLMAEINKKHKESNKL